MHYIFCISGFSGAGKDECAGQLVRKYNAIQTGLADSGKRHMADAYGFTEQQLYGPSHFRNIGDVRVPKNAFYEHGLRKWRGEFPSDIREGLDDKYKLDPTAKYWVFSALAGGRRPCWINGSEMMVFVKEGDPEYWLSPREALQQYLEKMNQLDVYTWIRKGVEDQLLIATRKYGYNRMAGLVRLGSDKGLPMSIAQGDNVITCFADFRHIPEIQYIRELAVNGLVDFCPILIRVKRPSIPVPPYNHRSETEQVKIRDAAFDFIVHNDQDLSWLQSQIDVITDMALAGKIISNPWRADYVIENRQPEQGYAP